jgi:hypothetical protein
MLSFHILLNMCEKLIITRIRSLDFRLPTFADIPTGTLAGLYSIRYCLPHLAKTAPEAALGDASKLFSS